MTRKPLGADYDVAVSLLAFSRKKLCELARHDPAHGPENLVSIWCQIPPRRPIFTVLPVFNSLSVNNLGFQDFHGMEEVIGSIPIRSMREGCLRSGDFSSMPPAVEWFLD
jgi:hypothetical protein